MDLTEFLTARLDEDEAAARKALRTPWQVFLDWARDHFPWVGEFAERLSPARVLREVAAKRAILALHSRPHNCSVTSIEHYHPAHEKAGQTWPYGPRDEYVDEGERCTTLLALAAVHSNHPDYDGAWKVS